METKPIHLWTLCCTRSAGGYLRSEGPQRERVREGLQREELGRPSVALADGSALQCKHRTQRRTYKNRPLSVANHRTQAMKRLRYDQWCVSSIRKCGGAFVAQACRVTSLTVQLIPHTNRRVQAVLQLQDSTQACPITAASPGLRTPKAPSPCFPSVSLTDSENFLEPFAVSSSQFNANLFGEMHFDKSHCFYGWMAAKSSSKHLDRIIALNSFVPKTSHWLVISSACTPV